MNIWNIYSGAPSEKSPINDKSIFYNVLANILQMTENILQNAFDKKIRVSYMTSSSLSNFPVMLKVKSGLKMIWTLPT